MGVGLPGIGLAEFAREIGEGSNRMGRSIPSRIAGDGRACGNELWAVRSLASAGMVVCPSIPRKSLHGAYMALIKEKAPSLNYAKCLFCWGG